MNTPRRLIKPRQKKITPYAIEKAYKKTEKAARTWFQLATKDKQEPTA